LKLSNIL